MNFTKRILTTVLSALIFVGIMLGGTYGVVKIFQYKDNSNNVVVKDDKTDDCLHNIVVVTVTEKSIESQWFSTSYIVVAEDGFGNSYTFHMSQNGYYSLKVNGQYSYCTKCKQVFLK